MAVAQPWRLRLGERPVSLNLLDFRQALAAVYTQDLSDRRRRWVLPRSGNYLLEEVKTVEVER